MIDIYESFENLEEVKKQTILNAGFKVFTEHGYSKTSVEQIIKEAGISKGSLFYYFGSKKNFYLYLYEYCGEKMAQEVDKRDADGEISYLKTTDFFERLSAIQMLKMKLSEVYPHMYSFMKRAVLEASPEIHGETLAINQRIIKERTVDFYKNLDYSKFKDGVDPHMVLQLLVWCSEGCLSQFLMKQALMKPPRNQEDIDFQEIYSNYSSYVELLRNNFYKAEYL